MARRIRFGDARILGAALALLLDLALLSVAAILVRGSVTEATGLVLAGAAGLVIAPVLGWGAGASSVSLPVTAWQTDAWRTLLHIDVVLVALFVAAEVIGVPIQQDGIGARLVLAAYAALMGSIVVGVLTVAVVVPVGYAWTKLMRLTRH